MSNKNIPKWVRMKAQKVLALRPERGHMEIGWKDDPNRPQLTEYQRNAILHWWDSWVAPELQDILDGKR